MAVMAMVMAEWSNLDYQDLSRYYYLLYLVDLHVVPIRRNRQSGGIVKMEMRFFLALFVQFDHLADDDVDADDDEQEQLLTVDMAHY